MDHLTQCHPVVRQCSQRDQKVLKKCAQKLADHHQKHQLNPLKHNLWHRRKRQISDVIHLEDNTP